MLYFIIALYLLLVVGIGFWGGRHERTGSDFIVGGRTVPGWAILGSLVATEVSAATYLAVPGVGYSENMGYLQFALGSLVARIVIAFVFVGAFFKFNCESIYQYLGNRFGSGTQYLASGYFILTRLLASGVRLMIAVNGLHIVLGTPFIPSLLVFGFLTVLYTSWGGIRAVIWTDCFQGFLFLGAGFCAFVFLGFAVEWDVLWRHGQEAARWKTFHWTPESTSGFLSWFNDPKWIVTAVLFGFTNTLASFGTDQDMAQRILSSRNVKSARKSLILSGLVAFPVAGMFLSVGVGLFVYFQLNPHSALPASADDVFPFFMTTEIPLFLKAVLVCGLLAAAMSSLDSAMAALSASAMKDIYEPLRQKVQNPGTMLLLNRLATVLFAVILIVIAILLQGAGRFLWLAFQVSALTYSSLLGVFLLGLLTRRGSDRGNLIAMIAGTLIVTMLLILIKVDVIALAWTWLIVVGAIITFGLGFIAQQHERNND